MPARPSGKGKQVKSRINTEVEQCIASFILGFKFCFNLAEGLSLGEILIVVGMALQGGILILTFGGLHDRHAVQRGICVSAQHFLSHK
jgi:hypothetical protein